jgi:hypothetical protein
MRAVTALVLALFASFSLAKLPPPTDAAKAQAAEAAAKSAWNSKLDAFLLCKAMDRTAQNYRATAATAGKTALPPQETPPCADPGPYASPVTPEANKPLEAAGAHSPPGTAKSPPSTNATAAEIAGGIKK